MDPKNSEPPDPRAPDEDVPEIPELAPELPALPEIADSARKRGISDERILHAYRNYVTVLARPGMDLYLGPDDQGNPLEIGVSTRRDPPMIVHAMKLRPNYRRTYRDHL